MRGDELGLSAFIAGTAIGYLIWYWARRRAGETHKEHPPQSANPLLLAIAALAILLCSFLLVALSFTIAIEPAAYPTKASRFSGISQWLIVAAVVGTLAALAMLLPPRRLRASETYRTVFSATLAVAFTVVLILFVVVVVWGPHSIYLHPVAGSIAAVPLGSLLLGVLFGSIGAEWLSYLLRDEGLRSAALEAQHKRWSIVLVTILFLGVAFPFVPQLLGKISATNITTPLGGVTFASEPISTARQPESIAKIGEENRDARLWDAFKDIADMATRDRDYARLFYSAPQLKPKLDSLEALHTNAKILTDTLLTPLGKCVDAYFEKFNNRGLIQRQFGFATILYTKFLRAKSLNADVEPLIKELAAATAVLGAHIRDLPQDPRNECEKTSKDLSELKLDSPSLPTILPYAAMGLAFLLYDSAESEQAMREIASWVEDHYLAANDKKIGECNQKPDKESKECGYYGYWAELETGKGKWLQLPLWYRIRIEFELSEMLMPTVNRRVAYFVSRSLVQSIEALFSGSQINSAYDWAKCDSVIANAAGQAKPGSKERDLQSRMVVAYLSHVDVMLRNLVRVVEQGLADDDAPITPEMLKYAEDNSAVDLRCLSYFGGRETTDRQTYAATFKATYGIVLAKAMAEKGPSGRTSELARAGRSEMLMKARAALLYAIPMLKEVAAKHSRVLQARPAQDRLFVLLEEQDVLRRAESALKSLDELLR
jgi:hypothetical protein